MDLIGRLNIVPFHAKPFNEIVAWVEANQKERTYERKRIQIATGSRRKPNKSGKVRHAPTPTD